LEIDVEAAGYEDDYKVVDIDPNARLLYRGKISLRKLSGKPEVKPPPDEEVDVTPPPKKEEPKKPEGDTFDYNGALQAWIADFEASKQKVYNENGIKTTYQLEWVAKPAFNSKGEAVGGHKLWRTDTKADGKSQRWMEVEVENPSIYISKGDLRRLYPKFQGKASGGSGTAPKGDSSPRFDPEAALKTWSTAYEKKVNDKVYNENGVKTTYRLEWTSGPKFNANGQVVGSHKIWRTDRKADGTTQTWAESEMYDPSNPGIYTTIEDLKAK